MLAPTTEVGVWSELLGRQRSRAAGHAWTASERAAELLGMIGNPHAGLPVIHVAGTNGKTTTARTIDALLSASGLTVARFTSPHLQTPGERITVGGRPLPEQALVNAYHWVRPALAILDRQSEGPVPFFTALTVLALTAIPCEQPDVLVLEVGVGGRDDATNVVDGQVSVITPVALDHAGQLGPDLRSIAAHKAGIIKAGNVTVMAAQEPEVEAVIRDTARGKGSALVPVADRVRATAHEMLRCGHEFSVSGYGAAHHGLFLPLLGRHQIINAMTALVAVQEFLAARGQTLGWYGMRDGLAGVTSPGRLESVPGEPPVVIDASHNPAGMRATADAIGQAFGAEHPAVVFCAAADKDAAGMLAALAPVAGKLVLTSAGPGCWDPGELAVLAAAHCGSVTVIRDFADAMRRAAAGAGPGVLVTGGVQVAAAARSLLLPGPD